MYRAPIVGQNEDGRLEVFMVSVSSSSQQLHVYYRWQQKQDVKAPRPWNPDWQSLGYPTIVPDITYGVTIKVMTFNIFEGKLDPSFPSLDRIAKHISIADIVFLQESDPPKELSEKSGLKYRIEGTKGVHILSRFQLFDARLHEIIEPFADTRPLLEAKVSIPPSNTIIQLYNTHFSHNNNNSRMTGARMLINLANNTKFPVLAGGDLNSHPIRLPVDHDDYKGHERDPELYNYLVANGLTDSFNAAPSGSKEEACRFPDRIDYILYRGNFQVNNYYAPCWPLDSGLSDHVSILVTMKFSGY
jgi:endonuclease/exonuclease/phosphatase family metal-dependent hydrolase